MNTMIKTNPDEVRHMKIWITGLLCGHFKPTEGLVEKCMARMQGKFGGIEEVTKAHYLASAHERQNEQPMTAKANHDTITSNSRQGPTQFRM